MEWNKTKKTIGVMMVFLLAVSMTVAAKYAIEPTTIQKDQLIMEKTCAKAVATFEKKYLDHETTDIVIERDPAYPHGDDMIVHTTVTVRDIE